MELNAVFQAVKPSDADKKLSNIEETEYIADGRTMTALDLTVTMLSVFREDWSAGGYAALQYAERQTKKLALTTLIRQT